MRQCEIGLACVTLTQRTYLVVAGATAFAPSRILASGETYTEPQRPPGYVVLDD